MSFSHEQEFLDSTANEPGKPRNYSRLALQTGLAVGALTGIALTTGLLDPGLNSDANDALNLPARPDTVIGVPPEPEPKHIQVWEAPILPPRQNEKAGSIIGSFGIQCAYFTVGNRPPSFTIKTHPLLNHYTPVWAHIDDAHDATGKPVKGYVKLDSTMQLIGYIESCDYGF